LLDFLKLVPFLLTRGISAPYRLPPFLIDRSTVLQLFFNLSLCFGKTIDVSLGEVSVDGIGLLALRDDLECAIQLMFREPVVVGKAPRAEFLCRSVTIAGLSLRDDHVGIVGAHPSFNLDQSRTTEFADQFAAFVLDCIEDVHVVVAFSVHLHCSIHHGPIKPRLVGHGACRSGRVCTVDVGRGGRESQTSIRGNCCDSPLVLPNFTF
jgi:hypothetical protein